MCPVTSSLSAAVEDSSRSFMKTMPRMLSRLSWNTGTRE